MNRGRRFFSWAVTLLTVAVAMMIGAHGDARQATTPAQYQAARQKLLSYYTGYNLNYHNKSPNQVFAALSPDRQTVFDSIVHAMFIELVSSRGKMGVRPVDLLEGTRAIWGVRSGKLHGVWQFRMSAQFNVKLWPLLAQSETFDDGKSGHVLLADPPGADDNPIFGNFQVRSGGDVETFRMPYPYPGLQISYLKAQPTIGEIDIDFDELGNPNPWSFKCHNQPSNSDAGSINIGHPHAVEFNKKFSFPGLPAYTPPWQGASHCEAHY